MSRTYALAELSAALGYLPSDGPREEWVRHGMALHSEFPGEDGFAVFDTWSQSASSYDARACRATWKSFKSGKGAGSSVGIGTLLAEATTRDLRGESNSLPALLRWRS